MSDDESEHGQDAPEESPAAAPSPPSPAPPPSRASRWLALIPVSVCVLMMALMMPRATAPDAVPLPQVDGKKLTEARVQDDARAARVSAPDARLGGDVLMVGTELRALNKLATAPASPASEAEVVPIRARLTESVRSVAQRGEAGVEDLLALRAVQLATFLAEVTRFERSGEESAELQEVGGSFVAKMRAADWIEDGRIVLSEDQRRVAYKMMWNALTGLEVHPSFKMSLDEQRVLHSLYIAHPHVPESSRASFAQMKKSATTSAACESAMRDERKATELWRAEKIKRLGLIDPEYPTRFALGVVYYRAGRYDLASEEFRAFLDAHPDGALAIRARNHLKAALAAEGAI